MILHALRLENWKNIGRLELTGLDHPLLVLYGPNRTGKSSIVEAIRCCLYDFDHDSTAGPIKAAVPWHSRQTPEVAIEFETQGAHYRLTKCFAKSKEGQAVLERRSTKDEWTTLHRGKEASREARKLLGAGRSNEGLNELLWLTQGEVRLPAGGKLNEPLQQRLEEVLGSLLTAHDGEFSRALDKALAHYFTAKTLRPKTSSPVAALAEQCNSCQASVDELRSRARLAAQLVGDFDELGRLTAQEQQHIARSREEVAQLEGQQEAGRSKRAEHDKARLRLDAAEKELRAAQAALDQFNAIRQQLADLQPAIDETTQSVARAAASAGRLQESLTQTQHQLDQARRELARHEEQAADLDDRQLLIDLDRRARQLSAALVNFDAAERQLTELRAQLAGLAAPDQTELKELRARRDEIQRLTVRLEAASLRLEIEPHQNRGVQLALDAHARESTTVSSGQRREWLFHQRAELSIESFGTIRIERGEQDASLDESARQLEHLCRNYANVLLGYGLAPADDEPLVVLQERRSRRAEVLQRLEHEQQVQADLAPEGREPLAAELDRQMQQQRAVVERRPNLVDWQPDEQDLRNLRKEFIQRLETLRDQTVGRETDVNEARAEKDHADAQWQDLRSSLAERKIRHEALSEQLERFGEDAALQAALGSAQAAVDDARRCVQETAPTEDELAVDDRLDRARGALRQREERLRSNEKRLEQIRGELKALHGLHEDLAAAEAELERLQEEYEERRIDAEAHLLLHRLFEECRTKQVQAATGCIGRQVLDWACRLGLDDYSQLDFRTGYLPDGLRRTDREDSVALDEESFGTLEQLALLARLAVGRMVADGERQVAILDDPLTHADSGKHHRMLEILEEAARASEDGGGNGDSDDGDGPATAALQILIFTCHPERFDHLPSARQIDLTTLIARDGGPPR